MARWAECVFWPFGNPGRRCAAGAAPLASVTNPDGKIVSYSYNAAGQRSVMQDPDGGLFTYSYHDDGRLVELINPRGEHTTSSDDPAGRKTHTTLPTGATSSFII